MPACWFLQVIWSYYAVAVGCRHGIYITLDQVGSHEFQVSLHTEELYYLVCSFYSSKLSTVHAWIDCSDIKGVMNFQVRLCTY